MSITRAQHEIDLIREYRTRLIADVVTGKLDVRGVEVPALDGTGALEEWGETEDDDPQSLEDGMTDEGVEEATLARAEV